MPYGMPQSMGGDTKESDAWMENCVAKVSKSGKNQDHSIAICNAVWMKKHADTKACYEILNKGVVEEFNSLTEDK
jgi:hypothetical protein